MSAKAQQRTARPGPSPVEQVVQAAAGTTAHIDIKNVAVGQLAKDQRVEVRHAGRAARRAQTRQAPPRSTGDASAVVATDVKNVAMSQMARDQRKEVTAKGKAARSTATASAAPSGGEKVKPVTIVGYRGAKSAGPAPKGKEFIPGGRFYTTDITRAQPYAGPRGVVEAAKVTFNNPLVEDYVQKGNPRSWKGTSLGFDKIVKQARAKGHDGVIRRLPYGETIAVSLDAKSQVQRIGVLPVSKAHSQATLKDFAEASGGVTDARQVATGTKSRAVRKTAAKAAIATKDTMTGLKQLQGFGNKAMYGLAVATPAMFATSAVTHGVMGWNAAKAQGAGNLEAAGAAAKGAAPATVALAAPTLIGRAAPKLAAIVSKAALPLTALAALVGAGAGAYKASQRGASWGGIAGGAALGAADTFTGGLASTAWTKWAGSGGGDATTLAINNYTAAGGQAKAPSSAASVAGSAPPKLTADTAKRFNAAERSYRASQEESGGQQREAAAPPESSGREPGFGPEAVIASYYARNPGGQNAPYGGDPSQAENYKPPAAPKDKKS